MTTKEFFKPRKIKIGLVAMLLVLAFVGMFGASTSSSYGRIRNTPVVDAIFTAISLPSSLYEALVQVEYGEACSTDNGSEYCEQTMKFVGVLPNPIAAVAITWIVMAIYLYLLACFIVWLFSLRKKSDTSESNPV